MAQEASVELLKDVMNNLFTLMLGFLDGDLEECQKLIQSINVLMKKVLEKSDQMRISLCLAEAPPRQPGCEGQPT